MTAETPSVLQRQNNQRGLATIEIVIAMAVILVAITATLELSFGSQQLTVDSQMSHHALYKAQALLEQARARARSDWGSIVAGTTNDGEFVETLAVEDVEDYVKQLHTLVEWPGGNGANRSAELYTTVSNWLEIANQGRCASSATGDWTAAHIAQSVNLGLTFPATGVDVRNGIAYVTVDGDGTSPDFFVIDVSANPAHVLKALDTGPGLIGVQVSGTYAYVANTSVNGQLEVINISTPASAYIQNTYKLPGSSGGDVASSMYYYDHKVYLGTPTSTHAEFHIVDVSNLSAIHELGTAELNEKVNGIYVSNGGAYLAVPDNAQELTVLDVRDPAHVTTLAGFDAPGASGNGKSLTRRDDKLFLGRAVGNIELYVLDLAHLTSGVIASQDINSSINAMATLGKLVFLVTSDLAKGFQAWELADDDSSFSLQASLALPYKATSVDCEAQTMYVTTENGTQGLLVISAGS